MLPDDIRRKIKNITAGAFLEGQSDHCTAARNFLCGRYPTSTTVKKDFESKAIIKEEQARLLEKFSIDHQVELEDIKTLLEFNGFENLRRNDYIHKELGMILENMHDENVLLNSNTLFFIDTVFFTIAPAH